MNQRTLYKLEYNKILKTASEYARSELGKQKILRLHPQTSEKKIKRILDNLEEASKYRSNTGVSPLEYFTDVKPYLEKVGIGGALAPSELLEILQVCSAAAGAKNNILDCKIIESLPYLYDTALNVINLKTLINTLKNSITPEGEVADSASSELREIRRQLRIQSQRVRDALERVIRSSEMSKYLQETVITQRNGRYVIPVKAEYKSAIKGIIHDQSATGSTVFIEPVGVVEAENEINRLYSEEKHEINRILGELSRQVRENSEDISDNQDFLEAMDVLFAKEAYCSANDCTKPLIADDLSVKIVKGRHPLIEKERCVPIDVEIGKSFRTLIITGPNTGGKTVSLKTVGLFVLLCQSGFFLPASHAEIGVFEDVLCDIGDEQAIEQNLSTFSSHMTNIIYIIDHVKKNSLVLFDELCTGTDPVEGSALARAILSELNKREILTFSTTHYSELKTFAFETEGMENASMEFDIETLRPTYRLVVGIPGKSNALEISKKLGLQQNIIDSAEEKISSDELNVNRLISDIEYNKLVAEKALLEAENARAEAQKLKSYYDEKIAQIADKRKAEIDKAKDEASRIIKEAEEEAREVIKELRFNTDGLQGKEKNDQIEAARKKLSDKKKEYAKEATAKKSSSVPTAKTLKPGTSVFINSLEKTGTVIEVTGANEAIVQVGILKTKARIDDMEFAENEEKITVPKTSHRKVEIKAGTVSTTLDLRGKTAEDAYIEVDRFIDNAIMANLNEVTLLHGKGTGALRAALHEYLRRHSHCESFRLGKYGEGDAGVTIVTLK